MKSQLNTDEVMKKVRMCSQSLTIFENALQHDSVQGHGNKDRFLEDLKLVHMSISTFLRTGKQLNVHPDYLDFWVNNFDLIIRVLEWNIQSIKDSMSNKTRDKFTYFVMSLIDLIGYISSNGSKSFNSDLIRKGLIEQCK